MTQSDGSVFEPLSEDLVPLWRAFLAGYEMSGEGHNGEYQSGCHNMPDEGHVHEDWFLEAMRVHFSDWLATQRTE